MPSRMNRRSGMAVTEYLQLLEFIPDLVCLVGVGIRFSEVECMTEAWGNFELYGFEPHPNTYEVLNKYFPGRLYSYAVSDRIGKQILYGKATHKDGASLFPKIIEKDRLECQEYEVETTTLDHILGFIENKYKYRKGLLWLDCEGNENLSIKGGKHFIDESISVINVELTGNPRGKGWSKPIDVHRSLMSMGFLQAWNHTNRVHSGQVDAIYVRRELFKPEFCSIPDSIGVYEKWVKSI